MGDGRMSIVFKPKIPLALQPIDHPKRGIPMDRTPLTVEEKDEFVRLRSLNVSYPLITTRLGRSPSLWHRAASQPKLAERIETARNLLIDGI
jgi:hypothetical protein